MPIRDKSGRFLMDQEEGNLGGFTGDISYLDDISVPLPGVERTIKGILPARRGTIGAGVPKRVLNFEGNSKYGRVLTLGLTAYLNPLEENEGVNFWGGPVVATIEFGNGGVWTTFDVDVPFGTVPLVGSKNFNVEDSVLLSVPASAVRVIARNDGGLVPLNAADVVVGDLRLDGLDGGAGFPGIVVNPNAVVVKAHIVESTRSSFGRTSRLLPLARFTAATTTLDVAYRIPQLAKNLRFVRDPIAAPIDWEFVSGINPTITLESGTIGAGVSSPVIPVPSQSNLMRVSIGGPGTTAAFADFEIGV